MTRSRRHDSGLSLVELLIAMVLSTTVMAATFYFFLFTSTTYRAGDASLRLQREAERVVDEIGGAVRRAVRIEVGAADLTTTDADGTRETFGTDERGRVLRDGSPILADTRITPALSFVALSDASAGAPVTTGVTIDLVLAPSSPEIAVDPVRTRVSIMVRNSATMNTPVPRPTATPPPTSPIPLPTLVP